MEEMQTLAELLLREKGESKVLVLQE